MSDPCLPLPAAQAEARGGVSEASAAAGRLGASLALPGRLGEEKTYERRVGDMGRRRAVTERMPCICSAKQPDGKACAPI